MVENPLVRPEFVHDLELGARYACFFSADVNSVFSTTYSGILFPGHIENTTLHHRK
jgi:hypothetical protein